MKPPEGHPPLRIDQAWASGHATMRIEGVLDGTTYRVVRDAIVKSALDEPTGIVIEVSALHVPRQSAWSVFASARWLVSQRPDVPLALVCNHASGRRLIARNGIVRYLPVFGDVTAATDAMAICSTPPRRRVRHRWPATISALPMARNFVAHWLDVWSQSDFTAAASVVTTALVDNVLRHTTGEPDLRLETDGVTVTVAVTDTSRTPAAIRDDAAARAVLSELQIVSALTRVWGNTPLADGKVVWAVLGPENRL